MIFGEEVQGEMSLHSNKYVCLQDDFFLHSISKLCENSEIEMRSRSTCYGRTDLHITGFSDIVHRPVLTEYTKERNVSETDLVSEILCSLEIHEDGQSKKKKNSNPECYIPSPEPFS